MSEAHLLHRTTMPSDLATISFLNICFQDDLTMMKTKEVCRLHGSRCFGLWLLPFLRATLQKVHDWGALMCVDLLDSETNLLPSF